MRAGCEVLYAFSKVGDGTCVVAADHEKFTPASTRMDPAVCALGCLQKPTCTGYTLLEPSRARFTCKLAGQQYPTPLPPYHAQICPMVRKRARREPETMDIHMCCTGLLALSVAG